MATLHASDLDAASRSDLIARAEGLGIDKADVLTRAELIDEIVKRTVADPIERRLARGLLGVARDLVARVVERGLHLPDAAALIRGLQQVTLTPVTPPIATVTLAEIYAGQGHRQRALSVLDEVLAKEPEHTAARALRDKVGSIPDEAVATPAPSEPPPTPAPTDDRDFKPDRGPDRDREPDLKPDRDRDLRPDLHLAETDFPRDTLPPTSDALPTLVPARRPPDGYDTPDAARAAAPTFDDDTEPPKPAPPTLHPHAAPRLPDADRVVLVPVEATSALAYWELWPAVLDEARARARGGQLILRIVAVTPSWDGPTAEVRDIEVGMPSGDWLVNDLPVGAVVRAAIGWRSDGGFDPLAVALDVASRGEEEKSAAAEGGGASTSDSDEAVRRADIEDRARTRAKQERSGRERGSSWRTLALAPWEAPYAAPAPPSIEAR